MPQPLLMLDSFAAAFVVSATAAALGRALGRRGSAVREALAIALGVCAGMFALGVVPRWPPREDRDRFLLLVLPGIALLEALLPSLGLPRRARLAARLLAAAAVAPAILHGSRLVADLAGPGSATWPPFQRSMILATLGAALFAAWLTLAWTNRVSGSARRSPLALAVAIAGASACVMLSGYATGGMRGLPIAGALAGAAFVSLRPGGGEAGTGIGSVALLGLLLSGWAFGSLKLDAALALFLAPLLCLIPEAIPSGRLKPWARTALALFLVATATAAVVAITAHRFGVTVAATQGGGPSDADEARLASRVCLSKRLRGPMQDAKTQRACSRRRIVLIPCQAFDAQELSSDEDS
ncbi:hypothetical protein [Paludisphaera sp.]|uniref:hypothetical protein n=1 Tax=Paludisphaera sp. TaxID=2017432 RepID=UPI00301D73A5